jgi:16S rRNA (cytidine1402-2'-O)-methyltransferase
VSGLLVLAGTPIGDPADAPARLAAELVRADVVAAEDTRRLRRLVAALGLTIGPPGPAGPDAPERSVSGRIVSYHEHNEASRTPELTGALVAGSRVLLVTDAGMPSVSDPGFRLVGAAVAAGVRVTTVPGPSAVLAALAVSGLPVDGFCFEGFLPRRSAERAARLAAVAADPRTMVFFEAPHRLAAMLAALVAALGAERPAAVCRELTKTYEEVRRGSVGELAAWAADGVRGEVTVVVGGAPAPGSAAAGTPTSDELVAQVARREQAGQPRKEAIVEVARASGVAKRVVFDAVVAAKPRP